NYGRSRHQRRREVFDGYAFKSSRAARSSRLASTNARKSLLFTPVRESSGECRLKLTFHLDHSVGADQKASLNLDDEERTCVIHTHLQLCPLLMEKVILGIHLGRCSKKTLRFITSMSRRDMTPSW